MDAYLSLWADDLEIQLPGRPPLHGKPAYRKLVEQSFGALEPESFEIHHLALDGDCVLSQWTITGWRRADRARVSWEGMSIARVRDGRIVWWREYFDPADLRRSH